MIYGTLYGVGVGPGAPDLLTLRAVDVLSRVDVVLAPASPRNDYSLALESARPHVREGVELVRLDFPMTRDTDVLHEAWRVAAQRTAQILCSGRSAAFLTLGDPTIYSTFGYLSRRVREIAPEIPIEIVPGITSFQAAAARTHTTLCEGGESLLVLPGINGAERLAAGLRFSQNTVILKAYRNFPAIRQAVCDAGCKRVVFASRIGLDNEQVTHDMDSVVETPHYLSLLLVKGTP